MKSIAELEKAYTDEDGYDPAESSYHPLKPYTPEATSDLPTTAVQPAQWLPCHYFDYIGGTGTGGIVAIMLGRLKMNVIDSISEVETLMEATIGHSRIFHLRSLLFWPREKYDSKRFRNNMSSIVERRAPRIASFPPDQNFAFYKNRCRTYVLSL